MVRSKGALYSHAMKSIYVTRLGVIEPRSDQSNPYGSFPPLTDKITTVEMALQVQDQSVQERQELSAWKCRR